MEGDTQRAERHPEPEIHAVGSGETISGGETPPGNSKELTSPPRESQCPAPASPGAGDSM